MDAVRKTDVLIAGAGPTGLVLALWLTRMNARVRIFDKTAEPGTTSRALAVQARTLELYNQVGLADETVNHGRKAAAVNLWVAGKQVAHAAFGDMGGDLSPFPYALIFPQDEHERLLIDRLAQAGVQVERRTELLGFENAPDGVFARLKRPDGTEETCEAAYMAGCDGAHSTVRETLKIDFPGSKRCVPPESYRCTFFHGVPRRIEPACGEARPIWCGQMVTSAWWIHLAKQLRLLRIATRANLPWRKPAVNFRDGIRARCAP